MSVNCASLGHPGERVKSHENEAYEQRVSDLQQLSVVFR